MSFNSKLVKKGKKNSTISIRNKKSGDNFRRTCQDFGDAMCNDKSLEKYRCNEF